MGMVCEACSELFWLSTVHSAPQICSGSRAIMRRPLYRSEIAYDNDVKNGYFVAELLQDIYNIARPTPPNDLAKDVEKTSEGIEIPRSQTR